MVLCAVGCKSMRKRGKMVLKIRGAKSIIKKGGKTGGFQDSSGWLRIDQDGFTTLYSLLKEVLYFFTYSEGFIPNNLLNCTLKYLGSLMPTA